MDTWSRWTMLLDRLHVVALPMRVRFRGITVREVALIDGPAGWGEFGAFLEYEPAEAAHWLAAASRPPTGTPPSPRRDRIPINATVPAVDAAQVPDVLARFPGARTAKVKVAEPGQTLADDVARVNAVRALMPTVRVDANGGWTVDEAVAAAQRADRRRAAGVPGAAVRDGAPNSPSCAVASTCRSPPTRASARPTTRCTSCARRPPTSRC